MNTLDLNPSLTPIQQPALSQFLRLHKERKADGQRLGQRFVNLYIKLTWPELFYEEDEEKATYLIDDWLSRHDYRFDLPQPLHTQEQLHRLSRPVSQ